MTKITFESVARLEEIGEISIQTGPFGTQLKASEYTEMGTPVINVRNIGYRIEKDAALERIPERVVEKLKQHKLLAGDIVFGRKGAVDRHLIVKKKQSGWVQGSDCIRIRLKSKNLDRDFLSYFFLTEGHKKWMEAQGAFGATMGSLNQGIIRRISFPDFPFNIQRKIAAVLSAYDDLIENNNRRIAILEKMAEELYREWFVRLRFPGHEKTKIIKGIPEGWEVKKIESIVNRRKFGKIFRESNLEPDGEIIVIDQSKNEFLGFHNGKPEHSASKDDPIILFGDHTCKMQLMIDSFSLAENVVPFIAKSGISTAFLYYLIKNSIETTEYKRHWLDLVSKEVLVPSVDLQASFSEFAIKGLWQEEILKRINRKAGQQRNKLLSRLMSGRIDLENLDIQFPASMQEEE